MGKGRGPTLGQFELRAYERLADVFTRVLAEESLQPLLEAVADAVEAFIPAHVLLLFALHEESGLLVPLVSRGFPRRSLRGLRCAVGEGLVGEVVASAEPRVVNDGAAPEKEGEGGSGPAAILAVPWLVRGRATGCLCVYRLGTHAGFTDHELRFATRFSDAAAVAHENARSRDRLARLARTDALTGVLNRRGFLQAFEAELARASRRDESVAVLLLDVDNLKKVNDRSGHAAGDAVLRRIADVLGERLRRGDIVGRIGGDEFAVALPGVEAREARALAEQLQDRLAEAEVEIAGAAVAPSAAIGVAVARAGRGEPSALLARADASMYRRKRTGRRRRLHDGEIAAAAAAD